MSEEDIKKLKRQRGNIKRVLSCSESVLSTIDAETDFASLNLETRLENHLQLWEQFERIQNSLEEFATDAEMENHELERSNFENRFHTISGLFKKYIKNSVYIAQSSSSNYQTSSSEMPSHSNVQSPTVYQGNYLTRETSSHNETQVNCPAQPSNQLLQARFELPKIQTPVFHGSFDTWLSFHDSFKSMCHDNPSISPIQKFHYLKACLKDEAAEVIASLEITSGNYEVAWELLKTRYDNRKFIIESQVKAIFEIPSISKEFTVRALLDNFQKRYRALKALEQPVDQWDTILIFILREKLNTYTREKWEESVGSSQLPSLAQMIAFLEQRALIDSTHFNSRANNIAKGHLAGHHSKRFSTFKTTTSDSDNLKSSCPLCTKSHVLYACSQFQNLSPKQRYEVVKRSNICHNCLRKNHKTIDCQGTTCRKCHKRHHTLLHFEQDKSVEKEAGPSTSATTLLNSQGKLQSQVILGTAVVEIIDSKGQYHNCRALLDSCSQCNAITEEFASSLGLAKRAANVQLRGIEKLQSKVKYSTSTQIKSRYEELTLNMQFLIFKEISEPMPSVVIERNSLNVPRDIFLADPSFHSPGKIDILIGAEYFYQLLRVGQIRVKGQSAIFQESALGWILSGRFNSSYIHKVPRQLSSTSSDEISCNLVKYQQIPILWELEEEFKNNVHSIDEQLAESHFVSTTQRSDTGRYVVKLPFNDKKEALGDSQNTAFQRFYATERKLLKNPDLRAHYCECIQGYLDEGHMSLINSQAISRPGYYLPHHMVTKEDSITTKARVVFDGSSKTSTGISLNETLLVGPTIQEDLFSIILRFRSFPYALTADIQQMYRQINVSEDDRVFQKILWRFNPEEPIKIYTLNTVTFGTSCAPFLAIRTLHQLADDEHASFPRASSILKRDFYVDDLLTGSQTFQEAYQLRQDLIALLRKGGFNLRKWASNHPDLCQDFAHNNNDKNFMSLDLSGTVKTLGIHWDPKTDIILFTVQPDFSNNSTSKRSILSQCSKLFDPLGLLGPVLIIGKLLIQGLWKLQLKWDDPVPRDVKETWLTYKNQLPILTKVNYKRCVIVENATQIQIHGFADASEKAYGACLYIRSTDPHGIHHCSLLCAKSRVAPLKTVTLPKLELCAAKLLIQLYNSTIKSLSIQISKRFFWSDSTIVLNWLNSPPQSWTTFVANRVAEIQTATQSHEWHHVPTQDNPADFVSRGQSPQNFVNNTQWMQGPHWLSQNEEIWPQTIIKTQDVPERRLVKPIFSFKITQGEKSLLTKFSNLQKLQRVVAYCLRFIHNSKNNTLKQRGILSQEELKNSLIVIIKLTQADAYPDELHALTHNQQIEKKSTLLRLNPFLVDGIIKVGGRLDHASIPEIQRHPIILPKGHHITKLIIQNEHINRLHAGVNATLYGVRESYWPIDGRNLTRHLIRKCIRCFRANPRESNYIMGNLPKNRVSFERAFLHTGVDFCGPFYTKEFRHRNRTKIKTYVSVFVCFSTRAVHLELANDLSTEAFLACLKRFFARRGMANSIHSDNATNFVGTNKELKRILEQLNSVILGETVQNYLSNKGIQWHFIPPRAPHFGGLWEAAVKSFKTHFTRIAGNTLLTYEQLHTYTVEIEAILNSRPLTPLSSDPNDLLPLTPAHFIIGSSMTNLPQEDLRSLPANRLSSWQVAQQMRQHFWDRWHREYLNEMISRSKWQSATNQDNINIGTLVVVKEDNLPPMMWILGRITETHPGADGTIRVVTIRTSTGIYKRALKKLYPLPLY